MNPLRIPSLARKSQTPNTLQHTLGHLDCPACDANRAISMQASLDTTLTFSQAASVWLQSRTLFDGRGRARYVALGTIKSYAEYIRTLSRFFDSMPIAKIHIGHLREYQIMRSTGKLGVDEQTVLERCARQRKCSIEKLRLVPEYWAWTQAKITASHVDVGPNKINQEVGTLICILRRAGLWTPEFIEAYERLQREEADIPRALSPKEQEILLDVGASREEWRVAYWFTVVALRTTASNVEMRNLRLGDINTGSAAIYIQPHTAKNIYRVRTIPLAPDALWCVEQLLARARVLGCGQPQHYLFPFGEVRNRYDPSRPMGNSGIKRAWEAIRTAAGFPGLRIHDLRHMAITRLAEAGAPIPVIMSMAGHISVRMMQHYTTISEQAQRMAVDAAYRGMLYQQSPQRKPVDSVSKPPIRLAHRAGG